MLGAIATACNHDVNAHNRLIF